MFDKDKKGTINIHEFGALFQYINQWKATFESIDKDRSGFIESAELSQGKMNISFLISDMYDKDKTGTINISEFQQLFGSMNQWKAMFESYDKDRSGSIEQAELTQGEYFLMHCLPSTVQSEVIFSKIVKHT